MKDKASTTSFAPQQIPQPKKFDRPPLRPWWRKVIHFIVLLIGWLLYFDFVWYTLFQADTALLSFIGLYILACLILIPTVTAFWLRHNIAIYKRKPHRSELVSCQEKYDYDWDKRQVISEWEKMRVSANITIAIDGNKKFYAAN